MKNLTLPSMALALGLLISHTHAEEKPMSISEVLKHTPEELAQKLGNSSEAGEDHAARLWAAAKRAETDTTLGKKSVQAIQRLNEWRTVLNSWEDHKLFARGIESGGGTMWSHLSARNDAWIESFLAKHMVALSAQAIEGGKEFKSDYLKTIYATIDTGLKEFGEDNKYMMEQGIALKEESKNTYYSLQYMLRSLPEGPVKKAVIEMVKPTKE